MKVRRPNSFYKGDYVRVKEHSSFYAGLYGYISKNYFYHRDCVVEMEDGRVPFFFWKDIELAEPILAYSEPSEDIYNDLI